ncbi:MAG: four helix bundle protein [Salinivirgaceae bacterium]|nr:four helix bundle protein [Salinivirgaceae bacterium]
MQDYKKLKVWSKAHEFALLIYKTVGNFPQFETFGLASQMRRSAYSIPTNIAEGAGRKTNADFANFLHIALGSANEIDYQLLFAKDLNYISSDIYSDLFSRIGEIQGMLISLINTVKNS